MSKYSRSALFDISEERKRKRALGKTTWGNYPPIAEAVEKMSMEDALLFYEALGDWSDEENPPLELTPTVAVAMALAVPLIKAEWRKGRRK